MNSLSFSSLFAHVLRRLCIGIVFPGSRLFCNVVGTVGAVHSCEGRGKCALTPTRKSCNLWRQTGFFFPQKHLGIFCHFEESWEISGAWTVRSNRRYVRLSALIHMQITVGTGSNDLTNLQCFCTACLTCLSNVTAVCTILFNIEKPRILLIYFIHAFHLVLESVVTPRNIHKYTWTSPNGKIHNESDHILVDKWSHSSVLEVRSFTAADCDTGHYLLVAKVRERLAVNKHRSQGFHVERFNIKN
jgi:hypothetical protein